MRSLVPPGLNRVVARAGWNVVDQALSALSNVLLSILVARTLDAAGFGAFASAFLIFSLVVAFSRAVIGQPLQITFASAGPKEFREAVRHALGAAVIVGVVTGLAAVVVGLVLHNEIGRALIALGVCLPGLLVQDICRMIFFSAGQPYRAAAIDAVWTAIEFGALAVVLVSGVQDVRILIGVWGASAAAAALLGLRMLKCVPRLRGAMAWTLGQRRLTGYLLAEYVLGQGLSQVGVLMVAVVGTAAGVGALRAAQVLVGPLSILGAAAFMFVVPEVARRPTMSARTRGHFSTVVSVSMGAATAIYCGVLLLIPGSLGERLLGATWTGAASVLVPTCVLTISAAVATGPVSVLYGMGMARTTFRLNILKAPLLVVLMFIGIGLWDAVGAAWAIAATETILLPFWFLRLRRALRVPPAKAVFGTVPTTPADPPGRHAIPDSRPLPVVGRTGP